MRLSVEPSEKLRRVWLHKGIDFVERKRDMKYQTRDFGEIDVQEEDVLEFIQPIFGFEDCKRYTIIRNEEFGEQIVWLQSLEESEVCFILFDPSGLTSFYTPQLSEEQMGRLGDGELVCWVVGVVPADFQNTTVNLKSPVVINSKTRRGAQIILDQEYPIRYYLLRDTEA